MAVEKEWQFPYIPVPANRLLRMHWARRRKERTAWNAWILTAGPAPRRPPWKARVAVLVRRKRPQDPDNAYASCKPLLDAMTARGWLTDDSSVHLDLVVEEVASMSCTTTVRWTVIQEVE